MITCGTSTLCHTVPQGTIAEDLANALPWSSGDLQTDKTAGTCSMSHQCTFCLNLFKKSRGVTLWQECHGSSSCSPYLQSGHAAFNDRSRHPRWSDQDLAGRTHLISWQDLRCEISSTSMDFGLQWICTVSSICILEYPRARKTWRKYLDSYLDTKICDVQIRVRDERHHVTYHRSRSGPAVWISSTQYTAAPEIQTPTMSQGCLVSALWCLLECCFHTCLIPSICHSAEQIELLLSEIICPKPRCIIVHLGHFLMRCTSASKHCCLNMHRGASSIGHWKRSCWIVHSASAKTCSNIRLSKIYQLFSNESKWWRRAGTRKEEYCPNRRALPKCTTVLAQVLRQATPHLSPIHKSFCHSKSTGKYFWLLSLLSHLRREPLEE